MLKIRFTRSRHEEIKFFMKYLKEFDPQIINSYEIIIKGRKLRLLASKLYRFYIKDIFLENLSVYFDLLIKDKEYFSKLNEKYTEKYDFNKDPKFLDNVLTTKIRGKIKYIENKPLGRKPSTYEPHSYVYDIEVKKIIISLFHLNLHLVLILVIKVLLYLIAIMFQQNFSLNHSLKPLPDII